MAVAGCCCRIARSLRSISLRASSSLASAELFCSTATSPLQYTLLEKVQQSSDSWLLRFALPQPRRWLGEEDLTVPTCIKVLYPQGTDEAGIPKVLEKSYSPVSHPAAEGMMDLVVKAYPPRPGGGVGAYLCELEVGQTMHAKVKDMRIMHGDESVEGRWGNIGLIGGGTGIAPLYQIARIVLDNTQDLANVHFLSINRQEEDILMHRELEDLASSNSDRFKVAYSLTSPSAEWSGHRGRGSIDMIEATLPQPTANGSTMILVCGTDEFVATWGGPVCRAPKTADGKKGPKIQGPLRGLLADAGYTASEVFKY